MAATISAKQIGPKTLPRHLNHENAATGDSQRCIKDSKITECQLNLRYSASVRSRKWGTEHSEQEALKTSCRRPLERGLRISNYAMHFGAPVQNIEKDLSQRWKVNLRVLQDFLVLVTAKQKSTGVSRIQHFSAA